MYWAGSGGFGSFESLNLDLKSLPNATPMTLISSLVGPCKYRSILLSEMRHLSTAFLKASPRTSTVHRGNAFEERSLTLLQRSMSMTLKRVGGKEDGGIDLLGWWWLPHDAPDQLSASSSFERRRIRVIGQCKAEKKKMGPNYVRELEGVLYRFLNAGPDLEHEGAVQPSLPMVALLISQSAFTKSTILRAHSSPIPFFLLHLPSAEEERMGNSEDEVGVYPSAWGNPALCGMQGLLKGRMDVRWERYSGGEGGRPALWWDGARLSNWIPPLSPDTEGLVGSPM